MYLTQLRAALATIHARWEHGHDGLTPGYVLCADEQAEVRALGAVSRALATTLPTTSKETTHGP